jgi:hypothetical protein
MTDIEHARLFAVNGPNDSAEGDGIEVQFNPTSLKVALSNTLRANQRGGNSRSAQYVDKSSSSLTVELIFDTSDTFFSESRGAGENARDVDTREDVRGRTRVIAETFLKPVGTGRRMRAPKRCLFQWGSFEFVGLVQSFDETLDFFSAEGTPLRATVALKLSEDRFQFRSRETGAAERDTPRLTSTGADPGTAGGPQDADSNPVSAANSEAGQDERGWRDTSLFNGVENPRLPSASALAVPKVSAAASLSASASIGASGSVGVSGSLGVSAGIGASGGGGLSASASARLTPPSFRFGASAELGTGIAGAFSTDTRAPGGLTAGSIASGGAVLRAESGSSARAGATSGALGGGASASASASASVAASAGVGFD